MSKGRFYYNANGKVVDAEALDSAVNYTHDNRFGTNLKANNGADRVFEYLTIAWDFVHDSATYLTWTAEITMETADVPTDWVNVSEAIIQSGQDELAPHNPQIAVTQSTSGTFTVPMAAGAQCRITCTATAGAAADTITWRACAHS